MSDQAILKIDNLVKKFGGLTATDHLSLSVKSNEIHALIGPNGAGKSTLIGQLCGDIQPNSGDIFFANQQINKLGVSQRVKMGLARSFQVTQLLTDYTVLENVAMAVQIRLGHSFSFFNDVRKNRAILDEAQSFLHASNLDGRSDQIVANLSHGEKKQLEIAIALASKPNLLLMDEPMAGLGAVESQNMISLLQGLQGKISMLLVEHDMDAVFTLADRISVLVYGKIIATGTIDEIRNNQDVREAYLGEGDELC